ncbi:MAG TPA: protein kinase [Thermoanaerobaculia bacterium]|nr:protein kinase [Thermoanaerobaculia bacterium]
MPDSFPDRLGRYTILSLIGAGGMGEVYLADDERLGRRVAIKIVPESVSRDAEAKSRLLREARAVAALDHPNVCTLYEIGEHDERPFLVMQYVEGETLFERLQRATMSLNECLDVATQVCAALEDAHRRGIIHRDIKPMNLILTPRGQVKVLDFGLARFLTPDGNSAETLRSRTGVVTGTAPYMSPEQLRGTVVDARTDIFSLGVVLYEMAAGRRPFDRHNTAATITAILFEDPQALDKTQHAVLMPIIRRALQKDPGDRYDSIEEMLTALQSIKRRASTSRRKVVTDRPDIEPTQAMTAIIPPVKGRIDSLAVLPVVSGTLDPALEYLVYGLSEGITNALSHVRRLRVIAAGTTARYAGAGVDARQVGRQLNVAAIVDIKARISDAGLHVEASLISTADGTVLWSSRYDRAPRDVAALAEAIADDVAERVRVKGSSGTRRTVKKKRAVDQEAQQLYLKGRFQWIKRTSDAVKQAMSLFQRAVEIDPGFAMPYAGLADSFVMLGFIQALPPRDVLPKIKAAARKAIELDPTLAEPHASIGYAAGLFDWDWETAKRELEEAMRLNPNYPWAPHWLGILLSARGEIEKSLELIEISKELDPLSPIINVGAGIPLHIAHRYDEAIACYRSVLETDPMLAPGHYYIGITLEMVGEYDDAIAHLRRSIEIAGPAGLYLGELAHALTSAGREAEALEVVEQLRQAAAKRYISPYCFAVAYTGLRRFDEAFEALEKSFEEKNAWMWFLPVDSRFHPLRGDPRLESLLQRYGLAQ